MNPIRSFPFALVDSAAGDIDVSATTEPVAAAEPTDVADALMKFRRLVLFVSRGVPSGLLVFFFIGLRILWDEVADLGLDTDYQNRSRFDFQRAKQFSLRE